MRETINGVLRPIRDRGVIGVTTSVIRRPSTVVDHLRNDRTLTKYRKEGPINPDTAASFVGELTSETHETLRKYWMECHRNRTLREGIERNLQRTDSGLNKLHCNWRELLYVLVRAREPEIIVETGVANGLSSAYTLAALAENGHGELISIDIGDRTVLPWDISDCEVGWLVPDEFRNRWELRIGDANTLLPDTLKETEADVFFSDVPNQFLSSELETGAAEMGPGSILVTSYPCESRAETTWNEFAAAELVDVTEAPRAAYSTPESVTCAGCLRK